MIKNILIILFIIVIIFFGIWIINKRGVDMTDSIAWTKISNLGVTTGSLADFLTTYQDMSISRDGNTIGIADFSNDIVISSTDGGSNWERLYLPTFTGDRFTPVSVVAANDSYLACMSDDGYFIKYDFTTELWTNLYFPGQGKVVGNIISYNEDAQYITAVFLDSPTYVLAISSDYGQTWSTTSFSGKFIDSLATNRAGDIMIATTHIGSPTWLADIYASYDYGASWDIVDADIDISSTGALWFSAIDDEENIVVIPGDPEDGFFSSDGGDSWATKEIAGIGASYSYSGMVDISTDGTSIIFVHWNSGVWTSSDFGDTWNERFPGTDAVRGGGWISCQFMGTSDSNIMIVNTYTFDGDDTNGVISPVCMSSDLGVTWLYNAVYADFDIDTQWLSAMDENATNLLLANYTENVNSVESILISSNGGTSWSFCSLPDESDSYVGLQISETGQYMIAISDYFGRIMFSNNYGVNWSRIYPPAVDVEIPDTYTGFGLGISASMSKDGHYTILARRNWEGGYVNYDYISRDYGVTWNTIAMPIVTYGTRRMNGNGSLMICYSSNHIYISTDYGYNWSDVYSQAKTASGDSVFVVRSVCCDYTSNIYVLADGDGDNYMCVASDDKGVNWEQKGLLDNNYWNDSVCSYNDGKIFATIKDSSEMGVDFSLDYGDSWATASDTTNLKSYGNTQFFDISTNETANRFISSTLFVPYLGRYGAGRIKSISLVPFDNISKVSGVLATSLYKIAGEEN